MDRGGGQQQQTGSASKPAKFAVYQNPAFSAVLTSSSLRPSASTFLFIFSLFSVSIFALLISLYRENPVAANFGLGFVSHSVANICSKVIAATASFILLGTLLAFVRAMSQWRTRNVPGVVVLSPSKGTKNLTHLTNRQLGLLGLMPKLEVDSEDASKKPPKSKITSPSPSNILVPLHQSIKDSDHLSRMSGGSKIHTFTSPPKSPASPSMYLVPTASMRSPVPSTSLQTSPVADQLIATPWSNKRPAFHKEIATEEDLERFLADVDEKISETVSKLTTPPPSVNGFGVTSPNGIAGSVSTSGTARSTPLRPVRMSPGTQKFTTPPKKGEGDLPPPMSMEESIEAIERLGIYPHIEHWRDHLRQWFSAVLLNPLLIKIENSHLKVIEAAAKLNISITISEVGNDTLSTPSTANVSPIERNNEWKPAFAVDEDGLLHQLRATLIQLLDSSKLPASNFQQSPQHVATIPVLQEGVDAITEHQRLSALMKGEWGKGLLPQSSVPPDYAVQRIRKLAEGTCLRNYEYLGNGEVYNKVNKKWSLELPSDSYLLLYLFCAFLEYPKWMLHVDPTTYAGAQASKNPLFLGILPPKERFPEKYVAVISGVPSVLHPGACILAVGKQSPPVFALYWDKKPQFSFQGRTALWDSILLLCYKIKTNYDGIVRGMHLGSSALGILPVLEQETED
ncbi:putative membrane protein [Handroanthus impetiginosus]|uniref:Putative membrane protein n=1 Tax=Handroanthus impetiginosus TaxID=429701 RepID=A0A2G9HG00_9LAMI|nr:putative membrane protein [Handroanthus impetiginosus]